MNNELILVLDFGGQYNQLIARRVREQNVYCEVKPYNTPIEKIKEMNPRGIIFTGGPNSAYAENAPACDPEVFNLGVPVLGICYGAQFMAVTLGGEVSAAPAKEFGKIQISYQNGALVFGGGERKRVLDEPHGLCFQNPRRLSCYGNHRKLPRGSF